MGLRLRSFLLALTMVGAGSMSVAPAAGGAHARPAARASVPGQMLVGFTPATSRASEQAIVHAAGASVLRRFGPIHAALIGFPASRHGVGATMRRNPHVRYAEPNFLVHTDALPNDPSFTSQWGLQNTGQTVNYFPGTAGDDIHAANAWNVTTGSRAVTVAVLDTGVDAGHPDLAANIWANPGESCAGCATNGVDNDGNGFVDDAHGWNCLANSNDPSDDNGHGTHVAGILGAVGNNHVGVSGVNWNVSIVPVKFIGADGSGTTADAICSILYAVSIGANVMNASWGDTEYSQAMHDAIAVADQHGALFVAAAGNDGVNNDTAPHYPASYDLPNVISVAATDSNDNRAWFSDYGAASVDIGAPGQNIYSTWPGGGYQLEDGTSMATPFVAGAAALVKAAFPDATALGTKALLLRSSDADASLGGRTTSGGRLDASAAVHCAGAGEVWIDSPSQGFVAAAGQPLPVSVIASNCASPVGVSVTATANGDPIVLTSRGDGLYTGSYTPAASGSLTLQASVTAATTSTQTVVGTVPAPITPGGSPVTVSVTAPGQRALLGFAGSAGQRISAALSGDTITLASVSIVNPDGSTLASATVGTGGGFIDTRVLSQTGTYTIVVAPKSSYTGSITLTLYNVPPDASGTIAADGSPVSISTTTPGQNATLTFPGAAGQRVSLLVGATTIQLASFSILKPDGTALASSSTFGTGGGYIDTKTLPTAGSYTILVNPSVAYTGTAGITLYGVPDDPAPSISPGGPPVSVSLTTPGQNARAQFAGSAGQRVSLLVTADTIKQAYFSILKPDGTALGSSVLMPAGGGFVDTRTLPVSGTYTILVDPYQTATGNATLTLYNVPPDAAATITPGGAAVTLTTGTPGQNASASFAGVAGRRISLTLTSSTYSQFKASILNPDGSTLVSAQAFAGSGGFIDTKTLPSNGTYTIAIEPLGATTGQVTLTLYDVPPDAAATITAGGAGVTLTTGTPGQNASATFAGVAGRSISLALTAGSYSQMKVSILNPDGTALVSPQVFGGSGFIDTKTLPSSGSYTIVVDPGGSATGHVTLALYDVPADAAATVTVGGPPTSIATPVPGQNATVAFTAVAGQPLTVKLSASTYSLARVSLLRPDGSVLVSARYFGTSGTSFGATAATTGTYTIVIDPTQGSTGGVTVTVTSP
jgi:subtilisin family serine protease